MRGLAELRVAKKSAVFKAIESVGKGGIQNLKQSISADYVIMFSDAEPFELSSILMDFQSSRRAKAGEIALMILKLNQDQQTWFQVLQFRS